MANGLGTEKDLFKRLVEAGFQIAPPDDRLDQVFKIDRVVLAPPMRGGAIFYPPPLAVQVTTKPCDWPKRAEFAKTAIQVCARLVYIELDVGGDSGDESARATAAALFNQFYNLDAPVVARVRVDHNRFQTTNLVEELQGFRGWLSAKIPGSIRGSITFWRPDEQYGFITAQVTGPDGKEANMSFYVRMAWIIDADLRKQLAQAGSDSPGGIKVQFEDGGQPDTEHWRKNALSVSLAQ